MRELRELVGLFAPDLPFARGANQVFSLENGAELLRRHFRDVELPPGAALYVYAAENPAVVRGPYEETGPHRTGAFWTAPVEGESAYVEYYVPAGVARHLPFIIDEAVHTYRSLDGTGGLPATLTCMADVLLPHQRPLC